jgi:hypothetical protein
MESLRIDPTENSPRIVLDATSGTFEIKGRSYPENVTKFFAPIFEWFEEYAKQPGEKTVVGIFMEYHNTATSKTILNLLLLLKTIMESGNELLIQWHHMEFDDELLEDGEDLESMLGIPFEYVAIPED